MISKAVFHLRDIASRRRLDVAAAQLTSGLGFVYRDIWFLRESGRLWCNAIHAGTDAAVEHSARDRFDEARQTLREVRSASMAIDRVVENLPVCFAIVEDYGQGVAPLCCLVGDNLVTGDEAWRVWRAS